MAAVAPRPDPALRHGVHVVHPCPCAVLAPPRPNSPAAAPAILLAKVLPVPTVADTGRVLALAARGRPGA